MSGAQLGPVMVGSAYRDAGIASDASLPRCGTCDHARVCVGESETERAAFVEKVASTVRAAAEQARTSVALFGNDQIPRSALHVLIDTQKGYQVVADTPLCSDVYPLMARLQPKVGLFDFDLGDRTKERLEMLEALIVGSPSLPVLILTGDPDADACRRAFQCGVRGLVLKSKALEDLFGAIDRIARGESWLEGPALEKLLRQKSGVKPKSANDERIALLTKREREIVSVVACGRTNQQVAQQLFISEATVRHHLCAIFEKLAVATRGELIVYAYRHELADRSFLDGH